MNNLTDKEMTVLKAFAETSVGICGAFEDDQNLSYCNDQDLAEMTGFNRHQVAGIMGSLEAKGMITDMQESARGASCNDYAGNPEMFKEYAGLAHLVTANF